MRGVIVKLFRWKFWKLVTVHRECHFAVTDLFIVHYLNDGPNCVFKYFSTPASLLLTTSFILTSVLYVTGMPIESLTRNCNFRECEFMQLCLTFACSFLVVLLSPRPEIWTKMLSLYCTWFIPIHMRKAWKFIHCASRGFWETVSGRLTDEVKVSRYAENYFNLSKPRVREYVATSSNITVFISCLYESRRIRTRRSACVV